MNRFHHLGSAGILAGLIFAAPILAAPVAADSPAAQPAVPPSEPSPYVEHQAREIKALSADQVRAYLAGEGMGLALPAELNGYPGPKHVLELAAPLELRPDQAEAVEESWGRMHAEAVRLGAEIVELERRLDALFAGGAAEPDALREALARLGRLHGELRFAHLRAHLETRGVLSAEQLAAYSRLRGYDELNGGHAMGGHTPGGHPD